MRKMISEYFAATRWYDTLGRLPAVTAVRSHHFLDKSCLQAVALACCNQRAQHPAMIPVAVTLPATRTIKQRR